MSARHGDFALLARQLERLREAAEAGDVLRMSELQADNETVLRRLQEGGPGDDSRHGAELTQLIRRALASIDAALPRIEARRREVGDQMRGTARRRQVSQSYR